MTGRCFKSILPSLKGSKGIVVTAPRENTPAGPNFAEAVVVRDTHLAMRERSIWIHTKRFPEPYRQQLRVLRSFGLLSGGNNTASVEFDPSALRFFIGAFARLNRKTVNRPYFRDVRSWPVANI